jgi:hypothetical protein
MSLNNANIKHAFQFLPSRSHWLISSSIPSPSIPTPDRQRSAGQSVRSNVSPSPLNPKQGTRFNELTWKQLRPPVSLSEGDAAHGHGGDQFQNPRAHPWNGHHAGWGPTRGPHFKHNRIAFQKMVVLGSGPRGRCQNGISWYQFRKWGKLGIVVYSEGLLYC